MSETGQPAAWTGDVDHVERDCCMTHERPDPSRVLRLRPVLDRVARHARARLA
jgi:hypothetical protein